MNMMRTNKGLVFILVEHLIKITNASSGSINDIQYISGMVSITNLSLHVKTLPPLIAHTSDY